MLAEAVLGQPWPAAPSSIVVGIPVTSWAALLERAAHHLGDPLLGLHLGQTIQLRHLGVLGHVMLACDTLGAALQRLERYQRLIFDVAALSVRDVGDTLELAWATRPGQPGAYSDETGITALIQLCRDLVRNAPNPRRVHFVNAEPPELQAYRDYFGCPVSFAQSETLVSFDRAILALPLKSASPDLMPAVEWHAEQLLQQLPREHPLIERVHTLIAQQLRDGEPTIEKTAGSLHCAPRTLQRQLREARTCFRDELARVRRQLAEAYLRDPRLQITDIASLLGYSEHSAFSRSYSHWTGLTPQQWRQRHRHVPATETSGARRKSRRATLADLPDAET